MSRRAMRRPPPDPRAGAKPGGSVWQRLWRRAAFRRGFYELLGLLLARRPGFQMLNCGHDTPAYPHFELPAAAEEERVGFQLYHRVAQSAPFTHADVIEFGCGRGGGARFLTSALRPRSYVATDASRLLVYAARRLGSPPPLRFRVARAERTGLPDSAFDIALAVEAVSPLGDKAAFLREVARLLRPGGVLLVADFFYTREESRNSLQKFRALLANAPFQCEREEDWTAQAVRALEVDSPRRLAAIERLPRLWRRAALSFAGTTQSPLYQQLRDGRARHLHFVLRLRAN